MPLNPISVNKNIPNIISASRIVLCAVLFFLEPMGTPFLILYAVAFLTDIIDGNLARMTNTTSDLGRQLDSIADVAFLLVFLFMVLPYTDPSVLFCILSACVAVIRIFPAVFIHAITGRFQTFHSVWAKVTAFMVFATPYLYLLIGSPAVYILLIAFLLSGLRDYPLMLEFARKNSIIVRD